MSSFGGREINLGWRGFDTPQEWHNRQSEPARKIVGLVEAAGSLATRVERNGDDAVGTVERIGAGGPHH
jgi:hypothetical protein